MAADKHKPHLFDIQNLNSDLLDTVKEKLKSNGRKIYADLVDLLTVKDGRQQITLLKRVFSGIKETVGQAEAGDPHVVCSLQFLVHLYFICQPRSPGRRMLASFFQGLEAGIQSGTVVPSIQEYLVTLFLRPVGQLEVEGQPIKQEENAELRTHVDTLEALLENFPLGEECLGMQCFSALEYLGKIQRHFFTVLGGPLSPMQQNEAMHNYLETVKLANRICQKAAVSIETGIKVTTVLERFRMTAVVFIETDVQVLQTDNVLIDCKTTSSMNIALFLRATEPDSILPVLLQTAFTRRILGNPKSTASEPVYKLPEWLRSCRLENLNQSCMSLTSYLCLCYGLLAMLSMDTLTMAISPGTCLLLDVILPTVLDLNASCRDVGSKLLTAKCVCLLTQRTSVYLKAAHRDNRPAPTVSERLEGNGVDISRILDFIWTIWEDSVDAIRFIAKEIFEHVISLHVLASHTEAAEDQFLHGLTKTILQDISWSCKGKYGTLCVLVSHLGTSRVLMLHDGIPQEVLQQMQEQTLACYACELYEHLFLSHEKTLQLAGTQCPGVWQSLWLDPVLSILCGTNKLQKKHTIEYILPKLLKRGQDTLQYVISTLSCPADDSAASHQLGALVVCLRRARAMGQLKQDGKTDTKHRVKRQKPGKTVDQSGINVIGQKTDQSDDHVTIPAVDQSSGHVAMQTDNQSGDHVTNKMDQSELWCGVVDVSILQAALCSIDEQVRLDAFALLCDNQKTTEIVCDLEFRLIRAFVPCNIMSQNPAFRQHFLSQLKKFLTRTKDSSAVLKRTIVNKRDAVQKAEARIKLQSYKHFLSDLLHDSLISTAGGSFARRTTALTIITLLMDIYGEKRTDSTLAEEFTFFNEVTRTDILTLLQCLSDSFEENKMAAVNIIITCTSGNQPNALDESTVRHLSEVALKLASSTRPQDSSTGSHLFQVLLQQGSILQVLQAALVRLDLDPGLTEALLTVTDDKYSRCLLLLWLLLKNLQDQSDVAKSHLLVAAANRPLYPTMQCIRSTLSNIDFRKIPVSDCEHWRGLLSALIQQCLDIAQIVSPVVHNCSPEGNIPVEAVQGSSQLQSVVTQGEEDHAQMNDRDQAPVDDMAKEATETVMLMPEYLVVCCWRSIKEISLLLGQLTRDIPVDDPHTDRTTDQQNPSTDQQTGLLSYQQILDIGQYFTVQLLESKHRGAFELAYAGFVFTTHMLWRSNIRELHKLPCDWLTEVMADVKSDDPDSKLCATRRSAGVPFYVQALVTTEPASTGRACFKEAMTELLALAFNDCDTSGQVSKSQVHAFNILRALFKDTRLADDVAPFIADGLKAAILGFMSPHWSVRNSATLLMSAMMVRVFGVKRSKDESSLSRKNCQTGRAFFHHYPSLYQFLLHQLTDATESSNQGSTLRLYLHPGLFPVLMLLGRLFPSAMEGTDTSLNLAAFIPYVIKCGSSPVLKTRMMAARALQPLVEKDHVTSVFCELLMLLPCHPGGQMSQTHIHGVLLQMKQMLLTVPALPSVTRENIGTALQQGWTDRLWLISRANPCLLTRKEALDVSDDVCRLFVKESDIFTSPIQNKIWEVVRSEVITMETEYDPHQPGLSHFFVTIASLCVKLIILHPGPSSSDKDIENVIVSCLKSSSYEVRKTVLVILREVFKHLALQKGEDVSMATDDTDDETVGDDGKKLAGSDKIPVIVSSSNVYHTLERMLLSNESHPECLTEVLNVLQGHPHLSHTALLSRVIDICNKTPRDEVVAAGILYTGRHMTNHIDSTAKIQICGKLNTLRQRALAVITDWTQLICTYSATENSPIVQRACARVLRQNAQALLLNLYDILAEHTFTYWGILVDLLQEDDVEVKDTAAGVISVLDPTLRVPVHPYLALDYLIGQMVRVHGNSRTVDVMKTLIGWMMEREENTTSGEERLFDRGEMNTYREDFHFTQVLDRHIVHLLETRQPQREVTPSDMKGEVTAASSPESLAKDSAFCNGQIGTELVSLVTENLLTLSSTDTEDKVSPYLNPSGYNKNMANTLRRLLLLKYGLMFPLGEELKTMCNGLVGSMSERSIEELSFLKELFKNVQSLSEQCL